MEDWADVLKAEPELLRRLDLLELDEEAETRGEPEQDQTHVPEPPEFGL